MIKIYQFYHTQAPDSQMAIAKVQEQKNRVRSVTSLGRVEPQGEVITIGGSREERIDKLLVQEGQQVKVGDVLAYLDSYQERLAEKNAAATQLQEARNRFKAESMFGKAQIEEAESRIRQIKMPQMSEIEAQKATVQKIEIALQAKQKDLERFSYLQMQGAISQQSLDDKLLEVSSTENELNNAKAILAKLEQGRSTDLLYAQAQVRSAQASLQLAESKVQVESANSNLKLAIARLELTIIRAPQSGQILKIFAHSGEAISDQGILQIGNTQQMYVVAEVYETDIHRVKVGQTAIISSSAFSKSIPGVVEQMGLQVGKKDVLNTDPAAKIDARVIEVKIRLTDSKLVTRLTNLAVNVLIKP
ncbi:DevB family ABC exporter membrane fusion protein [Nostoc commune NIES-4072]|uniref:DevB family ABC exporter membrane fusion protein n=1 Tax=Nostoc commune NIES-4072 TaxID=2005467 RepID=A0A2R5FJK3_NOSCO|nr:ABC exporter membrane fusion protein [Nostoc commune]BBD63733.1 DevB family ABC exporter membrane fusion protein [Nostoc commune HK-02]GBG18946.1 DevB family ABC exporter membrane fusion protein [Nostoc commune NIES-4072]